MLFLKRFKHIVATRCLSISITDVLIKLGNEGSIQNNKMKSILKYNMICSWMNEKYNNRYELFYQIFVNTVFSIYYNQVWTTAHIHVREFHTRKTS